MILFNIRGLGLEPEETQEIILFKEDSQVDVVGLLRHQIRRGRDSDAVAKYLIGIRQTVGMLVGGLEEEVGNGLITDGLVKTEFVAMVLALNGCGGQGSRLGGNLIVVEIVFEAQVIGHGT